MKFLLITDNYIIFKIYKILDELKLRDDKC